MKIDGVTGYLHNLRRDSSGQHTFSCGTHVLTMSTKEIEVIKETKPQVQISVVLNGVNQGPGCVPIALYLITSEKRLEELREKYPRLKYYYSHRLHTEPMYLLVWAYPEDVDIPSKWTFYLRSVVNGPVMLAAR